MGKKISELASAAALIGTELLEVVQGGANVKALLGALLPPGYIDGFKMSWDSVNGLTLSGGAAYIPSLGRVVRSATPISKAGLSLAASTWYHCYLSVDGSGNPAISVLSTAPSAPYVGTARSMSGDTSKRYLGSVLTDASGNIWYFQHAGNRITWGWGGAGSAPQRPLGNGTATTATSISFSGAVPVTATHVNGRFQNIDTSVGARLANSRVPGAIGSSGSGTNFLFAVAPTTIDVLDAALDSNQAMLYWMTSTPSSSGLVVDVFGYLYER